MAKPKQFPDVRLDQKEMIRRAAYQKRQETLKALVKNRHTLHHMFVRIICLVRMIVRQEEIFEDGKYSVPLAEELERQYRRFLGVRGSIDSNTGIARWIDDEIEESISELERAGYLANIKKEND